MDSPEPPTHDPDTRVPHTLTTLRPGEHEIWTLKRHPIGIFGVYALCGLVTVVTAALVFGLAPGVSGDGNESQAVAGGALVLIAVVVACAVFAFITTTVYWGNTWTLTSDSITQVKRLSLFKRHSSQLSLDDVEDVTSEQNGILARLLHYGLLRVETANERARLIFPFCPNPDYYASQILAAKETFEQQKHHEENPFQQRPAVRIAAQPAAPSSRSEQEIVSYEVPGGPDGSV